MFHVKRPVSLQQLLDIRLQRGHDELAWNTTHGSQQAAQVLPIKLRSRIIEQQGRAARMIHILELQLRQGQCSSKQLLLAAGYAVLGRDTADEHSDI